MHVSRVLSLALLIACLAPGLAWKGENSGSVRPVAEVLANAEEGDLVTVQGTVINSTTGSGSLLIVMLQDTSGHVPVAVPSSKIRLFDLQHGEAAGGWTYRVRGRWAHKQMDEDTWGIEAQQIDRVEAP